MTGRQTVLEGGGWSSLEPYHAIDRASMDRHAAAVMVVWGSYQFSWTQSQTRNGEISVYLDQSRASSDHARPSLATSKTDPAKVSRVACLSPFLGSERGLQQSRQPTLPAAGPPALPHVMRAVRTCIAAAIVATAALAVDGAAPTANYMSGKWCVHVWTGLGVPCMAP